MSARDGALVGRAAAAWLGIRLGMVRRDLTWLLIHAGLGVHCVTSFRVVIDLNTYDARDMAFAAKVSERTSS